MTHIINLKGWLPDNGKKLFYVYCENFYLRTFKKKKDWAVPWLSLNIMIFSIDIFILLGQLLTITRTQTFISEVIKKIRIKSGP